MSVVEQAAVDERRREIEEQRWQNMSETDRARTQALHAANEREREQYLADLRARRQQNDEIRGIEGDARRRYAEAIAGIRRLVPMALVDAQALDEVRQLRSEARSAREVTGQAAAREEIAGLAELAREQLTNGRA
jgi:hypothetical protein